MQVALPSRRQSHQSCAELRRREPVPRCPVTHSRPVLLSTYHGRTVQAGGAIVCVQRSDWRAHMPVRVGDDGSG